VNRVPLVNCHGVSKDKERGRLLGHTAAILRPPAGFHNYLDALPDLDVLPRHRLLLKPGGFEGGGSVGERLHHDDPAIAQRR
jgi:hypothetical protein